MLADRVLLYVQFRPHCSCVIDNALCIMSFSLSFGLCLTLMRLWFKAGRLRRAYAV